MEEQKKINLDSFKDQLISLCRSQTNIEILKSYSIEDQINYIDDAKKKNQPQEAFETEKIEMRLFKQKKRDEYADIKSAILNLEDGSLLNDFPSDLEDAKKQFKFDNVDSWMISFVKSKLGEIDNGMALLIAAALQEMKPHGIVSK